MFYKTISIPIVAVLCVGLILPACIESGLLDGQPIAGPMDIVVKSFEMCPKRIRGEDGMRFRNISGFHTKSRPFEFFLTSDVAVDFAIDDSLFAEMRLAQWTDRGGWKSGIKMMKIPRVCSALLQYAGKIWENVAVHMYGEMPTCPIPPVSHVAFRNMSINTKYVRLREFVYGKWRGDLLILKGQNIKGCVRIFTDISPAVPGKANE